MRRGWRAWWPWIKLALGLAILVMIGRRFAADLRRPELWEKPVAPGWLGASAGLYLAGLAFSAWYWQRLLMRLGERPTVRSAVLAYYVGHLGKYLPGKAWALFLRAALARDAGVRLGIAVLTSFYEVLTTMASGALLAFVLFTFVGTDDAAPFTMESLRQLVALETPAGGLLDRRAVVVLAGILLAATLAPLWPGVFNRLAGRLAASRMDGAADVSLPRVRLAWLAEGLAMTAVGWLFLGLSLAAVLQGLPGVELPWTPAVLSRLTAGLALAYVAGFVILIAPGGLGVREFFLTLLLTPELETSVGVEPDGARALAVFAVLVLRLVWTAAELIFAAGVYLVFKEGAKELGAARAAASLPSSPSAGETPREV